MFGQERLGQDVWFESEEELRLEEAAKKLEALASMLRSKGTCTLKNEEGEMVVAPAENVTLQTEYVRHGKVWSTSFSLTWKED